VAQNRKQIPKLKRFDENFDWKLGWMAGWMELGSLRRMWQTCFGRREKQQEVGELPQGPREGVKVVNKTKKGNAKRSPERGRSRRHRRCRR